MARWDLPQPESDDLYDRGRLDAIVSSIEGMRSRYPFRGRRVVLALNDRQLFIQNLRVPRAADFSLKEVVRQETAERLPYPIEEAELRFLTAGDIRQGDRLFREVIVFACPKRTLNQIVMVMDRAGLQVAAMDIEPATMLRSYSHQNRRDEDRVSRTLLVHIGHRRTAVMVADGDRPLLIKYIAIGGKQMDEAVASHLGLDDRAATSLRKHHGDRRANRRDPEVMQTVAEATRSVTEKLISELAMCCRYYSVTFRGQKLTRFVLGGGEATEKLAESVGRRLHLPGECADPFRHIEVHEPITGRAGWDVAIGAALRETAMASASSPEEADDLDVPPATVESGATS